MIFDAENILWILVAFYIPLAKVISDYGIKKSTVLADDYFKCCFSL